MTLRQEVHVSTALNPCARTVWLQHEQKHVLDNERLMSRMDPELRANTEFARILSRPTWERVAIFNSTQLTIKEIVGEVFTKLTGDAAAHQDSSAEYKSVERQIRLRCGSTVGELLKRGSYGQGVDMVQVALNAHPPTRLAPLKVDGVFGGQTDARVREFQKNNGLEPDGAVGDLTRAALGIQGFPIAKKTSTTHQTWSYRDQDHFGQKEAFLTHQNTHPPKTSHRAAASRQGSGCCCCRKRKVQD